MAYTTIKKPSDYFNTKLYTGNATARSITGVGFQPDWLWIKKRSESGNHRLVDSIRGATKELLSDSTDAEATTTGQVTSFDSDGFSLGTSNSTNKNSITFVAWNWLASNTTASNTDGSITSTVSANTTSGFSIVSWTGTGANATVGHGLSSAPKMVICKRRDADDTWWTYNETVGAGGQLYLNGSAAAGSDGGVLWNSTAPTSSVFSVGTNTGVNGSGGTYIAYAFADVKGFSKIGSYTGNGSADGTFVYTGFKPAFVMSKASNDTQHWILLDNKRDNDNVVENRLAANLDSQESLGGSPRAICDFVSNGFKLRGADTDSSSSNKSGNTYIYMAFAEEPLVGDNPATAR
jgi:hypothetical protein